MAKKQGVRGKIDEALIMNLMAGVDDLPPLVPKPKPAVEPSSAELPPPQTLPPAPVPEAQQTTTVRAGPAPDGDEANKKQKEYVQKFMMVSRQKKPLTCHLTRSTHEKLSIIVRLLGRRGFTLAVYVDNILAHHLETNKEVINEMINNTTKTI